MALKNIVYLSVEQYTELKANGSIIVDGKTIVYSTDDVYITPDDAAEKFAALQLELETQNTKITALQSSVSNLVLEEVYSVGSRYIQFPDEPTPAERLGGTWELDDKAMDKFLVGAGNLYALGATGGGAEHTHGSGSLTAHITIRGNSGSSDADEDLIFEEQKTDNSWNANNYSKTALGYSTTTGDEITTQFGVAVGGTTASANNLPPYLAIKIWKRKS